MSRLNRSLVLIVALLAISTHAQSLCAQGLTISGVFVRVIEEVEVPAVEAGLLALVAVGEGDLVKKGDLLAQIDDTTVKLDRSRAELELDIARRKADNDVDVRFAQKAFAVAQAELARAQESVAKFSKSISQSEIDRLELAAGKAELQIEQARRELDIARVTRQLKENEVAVATHQLSRRRLVSPLEGIVVQMNRQRGEWVQPGQSVLRIVRMDRLRAEGFVKVDDLPNGLRGRACELRVDLPGQPGARFRGKITFISPEIDPVNHQVRIWAEIENDQFRLRPGLRGTLRME